MQGIPALVILDAISGNVVVPANQCRTEVVMACRRGDLEIERLMQTWLDRVPVESQQIVDMLRLSCIDNGDEDRKGKEDETNSYIARKDPTLKASSEDIAEKVKEIFTRLVADGEEPNKAAASAIKLATQREESVPLHPHSGKASAFRTPSEEEAIQIAFSRAQEVTPRQEIREMLKTGAKYLSNVKREPWNCRFRSFKLSNKVADRFARTEGGISLLRAVGFEFFGTGYDFMGTIPVEANLVHIEKTLKRLIESLEET